ncbi:hypothetical protein VP01_2887g6 [Puccinia sorghi]|uniref:Uncharacterized protein n=1 Tax=Puccinia sorghi TaxID=27349 RepID=A0A0L6V2E4_9BASI|nr:hypothetical protein VP01_2887g6 [Puccinia sorghi]
MYIKLQYNFLSGMTPGASAPSMTTITHLIKPLVKVLVAMKDSFTVVAPWRPTCAGKITTDSKYGGNP